MEKSFYFIDIFIVYICIHQTSTHTIIYYWFFRPTVNKKEVYQKAFPIDYEPTTLTADGGGSGDPLSDSGCIDL